VNRARRLPGSLALASLLALGGCTDSGSAGTDELADASESKGATGSMDSSEGLESSEASSASDSSSSTNSTSESTDGSETGMTCSYPKGAVEPMALGEVLTPYSWTTAIHADGTTTSLDLFYAPCDTDEVIDWSIHEILVFISLPAW